MEHLREWWKFNSKNENGNSLVMQLIKIVNKENIKIVHTGGYQIEIDDKIYSFSSYNGSRWISIFDKEQRVNSGKYKGMLTGESISRYVFSKSLWSQIENLYKKQQKPDFKKDMEDISDYGREGKKFNL